MQRAQCIQSAAVLAAMVGSHPMAALGQVTGQAPELDGVGVDERLGKVVPSDVPFQDHTGQNVTMGKYLKGDRPIVLNLGYHTCPTICNLILAATVDSLIGQKWKVGRDFDFVSVSIDPRDTPDSAARKRAESIKQYGHGPSDGWHFLTGQKGAAQRIADAVGFRYFYNEAQEQYAHSAVMILLTPDGRVARYLYGLKFDPSAVRIGLLEASEGRTVSTVEKLILYCYRYDPQGKKYAIMATQVMKLGGAITVVGVGSMLGFFWLFERRRKRGIAITRQAHG